MGKLFLTVTGIRTDCSIAFLSCSLIALAMIAMFVLFILFSTRKLKKISPVNALNNFADLFNLMSDSWVPFSRYIFNTEGLLNYFLWKILGVTSGNIRWLDTRWSGLSVAMILGIWKGIGWNMVIFLAALQQVSQDLYEAAEIDGCGAWKKFVNVTLPAIRGTILFALIELTIGGFNVFTSIKMITGGKPAHQTDTLLTWMYYKAFSTGKFGYAAALSFVMALSLGLLAIVQFRMMRNKDT